MPVVARVLVARSKTRAVFDLGDLTRRYTIAPVTPSAQPPLVLHVIHHLQMGGMENGVVNLINTMPDERYRHAIACVEDFTNFRERLTRPDVEVFALHRSKIGVWGLRRALYRLIRDRGPALVHTRNQSGLDALLPARLAGVKAIHSEHGWDVDNLDGQQWKPRLLRRVHSPLVTGYVTVSKHLAQYLGETVGISSTRITQIYNGVDTARFTPATSSPGPWLPENFRSPELFRIGTVGRAQEVKDQATLLRAFAHLCAALPEHRSRLRLLIAGDGPLLESLRDLARTLDIAEQVWLPGARDNIPEVLQALDVFVLPSLNEGISNTILEAMACGVPALVTNVGGNVELVSDGECGRHFAPRDVHALSGHLKDYLLAPDLRAAHGASARARAGERFSLDAMVERYAAVYDRALQR
jgi:sugar transferase (PEP-CTERM/EpsH1 system associated)